MIEAGNYVLYQDIPFRVVSVINDDFACIGFNFNERFAHNGRPVPIKDLTPISKSNYEKRIGTTSILNPKSHERK